jgi:hypothetical protein
MKDLIPVIEEHRGKQGLSELTLGFEKTVVAADGVVLQARH